MNQLEQLCKTLEEKGYKAKSFATAQEAVLYIDSQVDGKTVGIGGCKSVDDTDLYDRLTSHNQVIWHWKGGSHQDAVGTDVYLCSANAISMNGEIVNIDGVGNRVASALYGHQKVIYLVGVNKITETLEEAIHRARNVASPRRAQIMNRKTPCAATGDKCYDCNSPERICRGLTVLYRPTMGIGETEVVLVDESMGL